MEQYGRGEAAILWQRALPFATQLDAELATTAEAEREARLVAALAELGATLRPLQRDAEALWQAFGEALPQEVIAALERLDKVAVAGSARDFYRRAHEAFGAPEVFVQDLSNYRRLREVVVNRAEVVAARAYLEAVALPLTNVELETDRRGLLGQIAPEALLAQPHLWTAVRARLEWFRAQYESAYAAWHRARHATATRLASRLDDMVAELAALLHLNRLEALGPPLGGHLAPRHAELRLRLGVCPNGEADVALDGRPICPHCQLPMTAEMPEAEVVRLGAALKRTLRGQQRRLSSAAIRRLLARSGHDRLQQLLDAARAADLGALVAIVDDALVAFLRQFLVEETVAGRRAVAEAGVVYTAGQGLVEFHLKRLAQRFPTVGEADCETVGRELAALLREALAAAKGGGDASVQLRLV